VLRCDCGSGLAASPETLCCPDCPAEYTLTGGIADFSRGRLYDRFEPGDELILVIEVRRRSRAL
jgi:hypothetical protein